MDLEKISEKLERDLERSRKESQDNLDRMEENTRRVSKHSMENFANWRDYLYKYYVIILAFIGGSGLFTSLQSIKGKDINWGYGLALTGIFLGFAIINIYFYLERKWIQSSSYLGGPGSYGKLMDHPDVVDNPMKAVRLHIRAQIVEFKEKLKEVKIKKDKKMIEYIKQSIRGRENEIFILYFVGEQFGFIEDFWVYGVIFSFLLSLGGIILIFMAIL